MLLQVEHARFERTALRMSVACGVGGLLTYAAWVGLPWWLGHGGTWAVGLLGGAAAFGAYDGKKKWRRLLFCSAAGVLFSVALTLFGGSEPSLGTILFAGGFGLLTTRGTRGWRAVVVALFGAAAILVARFVWMRLLPLELFTYLPVWASGAALGAGFGLLAALGLFARDAALGEEALTRQEEAAALRLKGELPALLQRASALRRRLLPGLRRPERRRLLQTTQRWIEITQGWPPYDPAHTQTLAQEASALRRRSEEAEDPVAHCEYEEAARALEAENTHRRTHGARYERAVARTHRYLVLLEQLRAPSQADPERETLLEALGRLVETPLRQDDPPTPAS